MSEQNSENKPNFAMVSPVPVWPGDEAFMARFCGKEKGLTHFSTTTTPIVVEEGDQARVINLIKRYTAQTESQEQFNLNVRKYANSFEDFLANIDQKDKECQCQSFVDGKCLCSHPKNIGCPFLEVEMLDEASDLVLEYCRKDQAFMEVMKSFIPILKQSQTREQRLQKICRVLLNEWDDYIHNSMDEPSGIFYDELNQMFQEIIPVDAQKFQRGFKVQHTLKDACKIIMDEWEIYMTSRNPVPPIAFLDNVAEILEFVDPEGYQEFCRRTR